MNGTALYRTTQRRVGMQEKISMDAAHDFEAKMPLSRKIPLGLQHVFAMFVGNLTPLLIIMGACGIAGGEFADLQVSVLQNAMFVAGGRYRHGRAEYRSVADLGRHQFLRRRQLREGFRLDGKSAAGAVRAGGYSGRQARLQGLPWLVRDLCRHYCRLHCGNHHGFCSADHRS